ncbi:response regulator transcription factor [Pseudomonas sp. Sample_16]|uniref:response regulator n=1 Tax=Pseudomonas sp. Sample_16 TaxID=2448263 RepID=UPI001032F3CB|nr:response regulator transcription factor [Pseudomonas sp. Sample_16]
MYRKRNQLREARPRPEGRILIADDDPVIRTVLAMRLLREGYIVAGEASSGVETLRLAQSCSPSLILLDLDMPLMEGLSTLRRLREEHPSLPVLVLSTLDANVYSYRCIRLGAKGFISKNVGVTLILNAINQVLEGRMLFPYQTTAGVASDLSDGEIVALRCLVLGGSHDSIASALMITATDAQKINNRLNAKLGMTGNDELISFGRSLTWS